MNFTILRLDSVESTNIEVARHARLGADEGLCVVAREQTAGRGRYGRTWLSEKDLGLYFSLLLRPRQDTKYLPLITLMAGAAVYDVLHDTFDLTPDIKWVNDVLINEKKICGILAETVDDRSAAAIVLGIGINLKTPASTAAENATSILSETGSQPSAERLTESLTRFLNYYYEKFCEPGGPEWVRAQWTGRSSFAFGKLVRAVLPGEIVTGVTRGIESNGALRIESENGGIKIIQAGDVERLRAT
jgi:BirA family transcriptional regulator, biotin operon repressor / biotin---[acetyl-CoA-carboxylase] ligase